MWGALAGGATGLIVGGWLMLRSRGRVGPTWADWRGDPPPYEHGWQKVAYIGTAVILLWATVGLGLPDWARLAIFAFYGGFVLPLLGEGLRRRLLFSPRVGRLPWVRDMAAAKVDPNDRHRISERVRAQRTARLRSRRETWRFIGWMFIALAAYTVIFTPRDRGLSDAVGAFVVGVALFLLAGRSRGDAA